MRFGMILMSILMLVSSAQGANINMNEKTTREKTIAVEIQDSHFVITMEDQKLKSIEPGIIENVDLNITTTWKEVGLFIAKYDDMTWMERIKYAMDNFKIPLEYMLVVD